MITQTAEQIADAVILHNYGPDGDADLYELTQDETENAEPTARDLLDSANAYRDLNGDGIRRMIIAAVERDRELRAELPEGVEEIGAYDYKNDEDPEYPDHGYTVVQIDTAENPGRMRVYINDGCIYDGDPETGEEWSLT